MQHQQVYTGQINKSLKEVMGNNLHKGVVEVHEKKHWIASQKSDSNTIQKESYLEILH